MDTQATASIPNPVLYEPNPHLSDSVNRNIIQSEIEGGVYLRDLAPGSVLSILTRNRAYRMVVLEMARRCSPAIRSSALSRPRFKSTAQPGEAP